MEAILKDTDDMTDHDLLVYTHYHSYNGVFHRPRRYGKDPSYKKNCEPPLYIDSKLAKGVNPTEAEPDLLARNPKR